MVEGERVRGAICLSLYLCVCMRMYESVYESVFFIRAEHRSWFVGAWFGFSKLGTSE